MYNYIYICIYICIYIYVYIYINLTTTPSLPRILFAPPGEELEAVDEDAVLDREESRAGPGPRKVGIGS